MNIRIQYKPREVVASCAECFVITAYSGGQRFKLFQVIFAKDGSLFVQFPYFEHQVGIVAVVKIPGSGSDSTTLNLAESGKVTSHLVKYVHHASGEAHFSQAGKVFTRIKRASAPLVGHRGHLFTVYAQRLQSFRGATKKDDVSSKDRTPVTFRTADARNLRFAGFWYRKDDLRSTNFTAVYGPDVTVISPDGTTDAGYLLAREQHSEYVLLLKLVEMPPFDTRPRMLFLGGFDPAERMNDVHADAECLAFIYPADNPDELRRTIGTIDFRPS